MQFGRALVDSGPSLFDALFNGVCVAALFAGLFVEITELAIDKTDVCVIQVTINVKIGLQPVPLTPYKIRQAAESVQIARLIQCYSVFEGKPFASLDFFSNAVKPLI